MVYELNYEDIQEEWFGQFRKVARLFQEWGDSQ